MNKVATDTFSINAESQDDLLQILLKLNNHTVATYCLDMGIDEDTLSGNQEWAIKSLSTLLNAELIHLGYVAKDARHEGVFGEYDEAVEALKEAQSNTDDLQQPIIINKEHILSSVRTIKISILVNAMRLIKEKF
ncbi:MAG TPA: hypothetical protein EYG74_06510 [Sulfurimonas autotrophica]|nr:hypothetical protein [Sulfurimonas autotrophica]